MSNNSASICELFLFCRHAVAGVEKGKIVFMNPVAVNMAGRDMTGLPATDFLPKHVACMESGGCVSNGEMYGHKMTVFSARYQKLTVYIAARETDTEASPMLERMLPAVRSMLASLKLASDKMAGVSEDWNSDELLSGVCVINHVYHQLRRLLSNLTVLSEINSGELCCHTQTADMAELCESVTSAAAFLAEGLGVKVSYDGPVSGCTAAVDVALTEQLLLNLISNSLCHTARGGSVRVRLQSGEKNFTVFVDDDGEGIPPETMGTVFSRWNAGLDLREAACGAGVGLAVARGIAEAHGGAIILESGFDRGTAVRVLLPRGEGGSGLGEACEDYAVEMSTMLTQLSTCLKAESYGPRLED